MSTVLSTHTIAYNNRRLGLYLKVLTGYVMRGIAYCRITNAYILAGRIAVTAKRYTLSPCVPIRYARMLLHIVAEREPGTRCGLRARRHQFLIIYGRK